MTLADSLLFSASQEVWLHNSGENVVLNSVVVVFKLARETEGVQNASGEGRGGRYVYC